MRTVVVRNGARILLGKQGENKAVRVVWSGIVEQYAKLYGDGRFELVVVQKGQAYPAVVSVNGADLVWDVLSADVATVGAGSLELIYYVGDTIAKSQTWETFVVASKSAEGTTDPPDPAKNWVDTVIKSSSNAKQSATESAESARQSAESSTNAQQSATESAESARQSAASSVNAQSHAVEAANSANEAHKSREAIENMEVSAASLSPDSAATVEKSVVDGKVKLTFGIPKGEKGESGDDIFWLNTVDKSRIAETFDEIVAAYKAGKNIWIRDTQSFPGMVATAPAFLVRPIYDDDGNNIYGMMIVCGGSAYGSSDLTGLPDGIINVTYYIKASPEKVTSTMIVNSGAGAAGAEVFYIDLAGNYPNYTCSVTMADIKAAYEAGKVLECRCMMGNYTATLPLFIPMPDANLWIFSGAGTFKKMGFMAQTFTVAIVDGSVLVDNTQLVDVHSKLPNPEALTITSDDTTYTYDGSTA